MQRHKQQVYDESFLTRGGQMDRQTEMDHILLPFPHTKNQQRLMSQFSKKLINKRGGQWTVR